MIGVNPDTVWTWNAIGKRSGAWNLDENAPEVLKFGKDLTGESNGVGLDDHIEYIGNRNEFNKKSEGNRRRRDDPQVRDRSRP